jgi:hypothetical protein
LLEKYLFIFHFIKVPTLFKRDVLNDISIHDEQYLNNSKGLLDWYGRKEFLRIKMRCRKWNNSLLGFSVISSSAGK